MTAASRLLDRLRRALVMTASAATASSAISSAVAQAPPEPSSQPMTPAFGVPSGPPSEEASPPDASAIDLSALRIVSLSDVGHALPLGLILIRQAEAVAATLAPMVEGETCPERIVLHPANMDRTQELFTRLYPDLSAQLSQQFGEPVCLYWVELVRVVYYRGRALVHRDRIIQAARGTAHAWSRPTRSTSN